MFSLFHLLHLIGLNHQLQQFIGRTVSQSPETMNHSDYVAESAELHIWTFSLFILFKVIVLMNGTDAVFNGGDVTACAPQAKTWSVKHDCFSRRWLLTTLTLRDHNEWLSGWSCIRLSKWKQTKVSIGKWKVTDGLPFFFLTRLYSSCFLSEQEGEQRFVFICVVMLPPRIHTSAVISIDSNTVAYYACALSHGRLLSCSVGRVPLVDCATPEPFAVEEKCICPPDSCLAAHPPCPLPVTLHFSRFHALLEFTS